jgi:hypothetical protein
VGVEELVMVPRGCMQHAQPIGALDGNDVVASVTQDMTEPAPCISELSGGNMLCHASSVPPPSMVAPVLEAVTFQKKNLCIPDANYHVCISSHILNSGPLAYNKIGGF